MLTVATVTGFVCQIYISTKVGFKIFNAVKKKLELEQQIKNEFLKDKKVI